MDEELIKIFKRVEQNAKAIGNAHERYRGTEIRAVRDTRGRVMWRINNRPTSRFDALAYFA